MEKKTEIILGVLAVAGISIYAYNKYSKNKKSTTIISNINNNNNNNNGAENTSNVTSGGRMACVAPKPVWNGWTCVDKLKKTI